VPLSIVREAIGGYAMHTQSHINAVGSAPLVPRTKAAHRGPTAADSLSQSMDLMGATMAYSHNSEIFGENEPAEYLYKVVSGSVRTYKILNDGRRQVGGFYFAGDIFGLESTDEHGLSAEAITDCRILVVKRSALNALAGRDASVAQQLLILTGCELRRVQNRILLLIKNAQERVAGFLLEMARRDSPSDVIELPMSRQDIADYLGLTVETVSRTLTSLECVAAIEVTTSRRIVLRNRSALSRLNG
jgi:CRP/FNR family transcriptional regulator, nitrogen fixation regulation protein